MTTTIDPKTARAAHVVEHGEGWSPRGSRMRVARPAEAVEMLAPLYASDVDRVCPECGFYVCACPGDDFCGWCDAGVNGAPCTCPDAGEEVDRG